jgi:hypothetical protein
MLILFISAITALLAISVGTFAFFVTCKQRDLRAKVEELSSEHQLFLGQLDQIEQLIEQSQAESDPTSEASLPTNTPEHQLLGYAWNELAFDPDTEFSKAIMRYLRSIRFSHGLQDSIEERETIKIILGEDPSKISEHFSNHWLSQREREQFDDESERRACDEVGYYRRLCNT